MSVCGWSPGQTGCMFEYQDCVMFAVCSSVLWCTGQPSQNVLLACYTG
jgi:hypothetical protein